MRSKEREDQSNIISITMTVLYCNSHEQDTDSLYWVAIAIIVLTDKLLMPQNLREGKAMAMATKYQ